MQNKVILTGELVRKPYMGETPNGYKKASFTLKIDNNYIEMDSFKNINTLEQLKGGETLKVTGSLKKFKSNKYDTYLLTINVDTVEVVETIPEIEEQTQKAEEPFVSYEISMDDLPF